MKTSRQIMSVELLMLMIGVLQTNFSRWLAKCGAHSRWIVLLVSTTHNYTKSFPDFGIREPQELMLLLRNGQMRMRYVLVPPVVLIPSVLSYLHSCCGKGTLVFPWWPSKFLFWPLLRSCYRPCIKYLVTMKGYIALKHGRNTCSR